MTRLKSNMFVDIQVNTYTSMIVIMFRWQVNTTETSITLLASRYTKDELEFFKKLVIGSILSFCVCWVGGGGGDFYLKILEFFLFHH